MSATLHTLPEPVPEGWEPPGCFGRTWFRRTSGVWLNVSDGSVYDAVHEEWTPPTGQYHPQTWPTSTPCATLAEACAAAERAYCGCRVVPAKPLMERIMDAHDARRGADGPDEKPRYRAQPGHGDPR